jgi:hypothetical protein
MVPIDSPRGFGCRTPCRRTNVCDLPSSDLSTTSIPKSMRIACKIVGDLHGGLSVRAMRRLGCWRGVEHLLFAHFRTRRGAVKRSSTGSTPARTREMRARSTARTSGPPMARVGHPKVEPQGDLLPRSLVVHSKLLEYIIVRAPTGFTTTSACVAAVREVCLPRSAGTAGTQLKASKVVRHA